MARHHELWAGWPESVRLTDDQLKARMVEDNLISAGSHNYDIMDFGKLVAAARERLRINYRNRH